MAKSFLWEPFFPVQLDDTILHALLLLSKHRLQVLPVIQQPDAVLIGFVTQVSVELLWIEEHVCIFLKIYILRMTVVFSIMLEFPSPTTSSIKQTRVV